MFDERGTLNCNRMAHGWTFVRDEASSDELVSQVMGSWFMALSEKPAKGALLFALLTALKRLLGDLG